MIPEFAEAMRSGATELDLSDILKQPVGRLLGVSADAANVLQTIGVATIFDLGAASSFAAARAAAGAGSAGDIIDRAGMIPGDWLQPDAVYGSLDDIGDLPLEALRALTAGQATALKTALDVTTIGEFANWPPQAVARRLLGDSTGADTDVDELQTEALRPRFGDYPTERVYYSTLVMLDIGSDPANLVELDGPISLGQSLAGGVALQKPAVGAQVTFSQSWYAQGITLGQMVHSLALAPGEATRVAVIDWMRSSMATTSEAISEGESLASSTSHNRSLSEVQNAVANEMQSGGSTSHVHSESDSGGIGGGISAIVPVAGALIGGAFGGSYQGASTTTDANSTSWSLGSRSVTANMAQTVNDRTEQHSTLVRNRRATAVREVSETEHQQVSTRIVANYNHMHALTVQYYEVVQLYRIATEVQTAERVLFVPIEMVDFSDDQIIDTYRGTLARAALTARARELLLDPTDTIELQPAKSYRSALLDGVLSGLLVRDAVLAPMVFAPSGDGAAAAMSGAAATAAGTAQPEVMARMATAVAKPLVSVGSFLNNDDAVVRGSAIVMCPVIRPQSDSLFYPDETEIVAVQLEGLAVTSVTVATTAGGTSDMTLPGDSTIIELTNPVSLGDLSSISVKTGGAAAARGLIRLQLGFRGRRFTTPAIPVALPASAAGASFAVLRTHSDTADRRAELKAHLTANRAHYSAQIFRSLGSAAVVSLLAKYKWQGKPLVDLVEPKVLSVAGNYIVLRAPVEGTEASGITDGQGQAQNWGAVLKSRGLEPHSTKDTRLVPIPTDGVFAEAVLGRSNSAEKLDITRFWNWQDSPAPLTPPELAPVSSDSRALPENLMPGQLGPSTLNIVNPTNLPDPSGLGASLGALANLNFRDMSGLAGTQQLAGTATTGTLTATTEAGKNAVAMAQVAADVVKTAMVTGYGKKKEGGISGEGARINQGRDLDQRTGANLGTASGAGGGSAGTAGGGTSANGTGLDGGGGSPAGLGGGSAGTGSGYEASAFNDSVGSPLGTSIPQALAALFGGGATAPAATPTSKMDRPTAVAQATTMINNFRTSTQPGKWHATLGRKEVADRLIALINNPDILDQTGNGLCGEAAFFNIWLWEDPYAVARFGVQLFNGGAAAVGTEEWVRPRPSLLGQNFDNVVNQINRPGARDAIAEWMMMSALRDANNYIFSYDGVPSDEWGAGSSDGEVARWLRATNLFSSVSAKTGGSEEHNWAHASQLVPGADVIMVACDSHMLGNPLGAGGVSNDHWFVLKSAITERNNTVDFRFWCWGEPAQWVNDRRADANKVGTPLPGDLQKTQFANEYFGYLIAKR